MNGINALPYVIKNKKTILASGGACTCYARAELATPGRIHFKISSLRICVGYRDLVTRDQAADYLPF